MERVESFLARLDEGKIYYRLNRVRESIMVEIAVPGQRWEVEFLDDGEIQIEKFISTGEIHGASEIDRLFGDFSN